MNFFVIQTMETLHDGEELVFLYQLVDGHTSSSYASHIASQVGLPQEIIKRGTEVIMTVISLVLMCVLKNN